jgi:hypothetical protein
MTQPYWPAFGRATVGAAIVGLAIVGSVLGCSPADIGGAELAVTDARTQAPPAQAAAPTPEPTRTPTVRITPEPNPTPEPTPSPVPTPVPTPTPVVEIYDDFLTAGVEDRAIFQGMAGSYTWSTVEFPAKQVLLRWDATSTGAACKVNWLIDPTSGATLRGTIAVAAGARLKGSKEYRTAFGEGAVIVVSRCDKFLVTMQGRNPAPAPASGGGGNNCHPSYSPCLPIGPDLDCPDVRAMGKAPVRVMGPDSYRLDGDHDGIGCE